MNFSTTKTMCQAATMREVGQAVEENVSAEEANENNFSRKERVPIETVLAPPSALARYTCVSIVMAVFAIWGKFAFIDEAQIPGGQGELHSWTVPMAMTFSYLISLPLLRSFAKHFLSSNVDVKALLCESMILYNAVQVLLNGWMVYRILDAVLFRGHPFIGGPIYLVDTGASYAVWVHYLNKYLEFMDTFFMVLRGKMDQVSFLHVYHHTSIAWAWWFGLKLYPGGDIYFGALLNSWIHVMMYSYYTLSLLKISCPWKKYLTQAQLIQFLSVLVYTSCSLYRMKDGNWRHYAACSIQTFEMISLFVLFMHFYSKAYSKKKSTASLKEPSSADSDSGSDAVAAEQASISSASSDEQS